MKVKQKEMRGRIEYIDNAKGILILMMLIGHIWNDGLVHDIIYVFHMPAFFVITGILFNHSSSLEKPLLQNVIERIQRYLVPYLCFEVLGIAADIFRNGVTLNIKGYIFEIISLHLYNGPLWFLMCIFCCQLLCLFTAKLHTPNTVVLTLLFFLVLTLPKLPPYNGISTTVTGSFFLMFGSCYEDIVLKKPPTWRILLVVCLVTFISSFNGVEMPNYQDGNRLLFVVGAISGTYMVLCISKQINSKMLRYFGYNSLIILGSHYPIIRVTKHLLGIEEFSILGGICFFVILLVVEVPLIEIINLLFPFAAGKGFKRQ